MGVGNLEGREGGFLRDILWFCIPRLGICILLGCMGGFLLLLAGGLDTDEVARL